MFIRFEVFGTKSLLLLDRRQYLGKKTSTVTINIILPEYRNNLRILAFIFLGRSNFNY